MSKRILVADDSLTIQKVINITLASYDYDLIECHNETQLYEQLENGPYDLVLLDFNISENKK